MPANTLRWSQRCHVDRSVSKLISEHRVPRAYRYDWTLFADWRTALDWALLPRHHRTRLGSFGRWSGWCSLTCTVGWPGGVVGRRDAALLMFTALGYTPTKINRLDRCAADRRNRTRPGSCCRGARRVCALARGPRSASRDAQFGRLDQRTPQPHCAGGVDRVRSAAGTYGAVRADRPLGTPSVDF
jgi:hypothetical protein